MIPIASSTSLSIEKSAKLLQSLVDLKDKNLKLPKKLAKSVHGLLNAQRVLLKEIDDLLHDPSKKDDNEDNLDLLKIIVERALS